MPAGCHLLPRMLQTPSSTACTALLCGDVYDSNDFHCDRYHDEDNPHEAGGGNESLCSNKLCTEATT
jgi:hypothetical protein